MLDKSKLPGDLWVRMTWIPEAGSGPEERPIVLVSDRRRWVIGLIPAVLGILLLGALFRGHAPVALLILPGVIVLAGGRYAAGGHSGYYEVSEDGSLGDFLGKRIPPVLRYMRRAKS